MVAARLACVARRHADRPAEAPCVIAAQLTPQESRRNKTHHPHLVLSNAATFQTPPDLISWWPPPDTEGRQSNNRPAAPATLSLPGSSFSFTRHTGVAQSEASSTGLLLLPYHHTFPHPTLHLARTVQDHDDGGGTSGGVGERVPLPGVQRGGVNGSNATENNGYGGDNDSPRWSRPLTQNGDYHSRMAAVPATRSVVMLEAQWRWLRSADGCNGLLDTVMGEANLRATGNIS